MSLSVPFCPYHFVRTILSVPFCPYHLVPYHSVLEPCCPHEGSTTIRLRTFSLRHFVYRHFVYRHFVYYCIPACRSVIHPTSVSANHYFHQFQLQLTL